MIRIQLHGWIGGLIFIVGVGFTLWLRSSDEGLEFSERNESLFAFAYVAQVLLFVLVGLWVATNGFTVNPLK